MNTFLLLVLELGFAFISGPGRCGVIGQVDDGAAVIFDITALAVLRDPSLSPAENEVLSNFGVASSEDKESSYPKAFRDLTACLSSEKNNFMPRFLAERKEWLSIVLARTLRRISLEQKTGPILARILTNLQSGMFPWAIDALDVLRITDPDVLECVAKNRQRWSDEYGLQESYSAELDHAQDWIDKVFSWCKPLKTYHRKIMPQPLLQENTGFSEHVSDGLMLVIGGSPKELAENSLILHEAFHQPLWDVISSSPSIRRSIRDSECVFEAIRRTDSQLFGYENWISLFSEALIRSMTRKISRQKGSNLWKIENHIDDFVDTNWLDIQQGWQFFPDLLESLKVNFCSSAEVFLD